MKKFVVLFVSVFVLLSCVVIAGHGDPVPGVVVKRGISKVRNENATVESCSTDTKGKFTLRVVVAGSNSISGACTIHSKDVRLAIETANKRHPRKDGKSHSIVLVIDSPSVAIVNGKRVSGAIPLSSTQDNTISFEATKDVSVSGTITTANE